jgi:hypothetical protein
MQYTVGRAYTGIQAGAYVSDGQRRCPFGSLETAASAALMSEREDDHFSIYESGNGEWAFKNSVPFDAGRWENENGHVAEIRCVDGEFCARWWSDREDYLRYRPARHETGSYPTPWNIPLPNGNWRRFVPVPVVEPAPALKPELVTAGCFVPGADADQQTDTPDRQTGTVELPRADLVDLLRQLFSPTSETAPEPATEGAKITSPGWWCRPSTNDVALAYIEEDVLRVISIRASKDGCAYSATCNAAGISTGGDWRPLNF